MEKVKIFGICGSARHASTEWAVKLALETARKYDYVETDFANLGDHMAPYKIPKYIEFRDMLPKSKVGKLLRREIREEERLRRL